MLDATAARACEPAAARGLCNDSDGSPDHGNGVGDPNPSPPPRELTSPGPLRDRTLSFDTGRIPSNDGGDGASDLGPPPDEPPRLPGEPDASVEALMARAPLKRSCNKWAPSSGGQSHFAL